MKSRSVVVLSIIFSMVFGLVGTVTAKQVELEFFLLKPEVESVMNEIISDFMTEYPDIKVTQTAVADAGTVLLTRIATYDMPDTADLPCGGQANTCLTMGFSLT